MPIFSLVDTERVGVQDIEIIEEGEEPEDFFKAFP